MLDATQYKQEGYALDTDQHCGQNQKSKALEIEIK
jgi:hypothetical protein